MWRVIPPGAFFRAREEVQLCTQMASLREFFSTCVCEVFGLYHVPDPPAALLFISGSVLLPWTCSLLSRWHVSWYQRVCAQLIRHAAIVLWCMVLTGNVTGEVLTLLQHIQNTGQITTGSSIFLNNMNCEKIRSLLSMEKRCEKKQELGVCRVWAAERVETLLWKNENTWPCFATLNTQNYSFYVDKRLYAPTIWNLCTDFGDGLETKNTDRV